MGIDPVSAGIQAALARQRVSAVNIANQLTEGYRAYRVVQTEGAPRSGPEHRVERTDAPVDLAGEIVSQIASGQEVALYAAVLRRQHETVGRLIDMLA